MREKCVDAAFVLRRLKDELSPSVFLLDSIVMLYGDRPVRVAIRSDPDAEDGEIHSERENRSTHYERYQSQKKPP